MAAVRRRHPSGSVSAAATVRVDPRQLLISAASRIGATAPSWTGRLRCGVDLGTATVVLVVVDEGAEPVLVEATPCEALRDGVVVDFAAAVRAVVEVRTAAESHLGVALTEAATAFPPGVGASESRACRFVIERAGLDCVALVDEVTAAQTFLGIDNGVIVDVGGGSTGVGIVRNGQIVDVGDVPGGGHHLDLILAGALRLTVIDAERAKREQGAVHLAILRPGLERVATSIAQLSRGHEQLPVHLVGGGLMIPGAGSVIAERLGRDVVEYPHALYITPIGIAGSAP